MGFIEDVARASVVLSDVQLSELAAARRKEEVRRARAQ